MGFSDERLPVGHLDGQENRGARQRRPTLARRRGYRSEVGLVVQPGRRRTVLGSTARSTPESAHPRPKTRVTTPRATTRTPSRSMNSAPGNTLGGEKMNQ